MKRKTIESIFGGIVVFIICSGHGLIGSELYTPIIKTWDDYIAALPIIMVASLLVSFSIYIFRD